MTARILITGSRTWKDRETIYQALADAWATRTTVYPVLVHGGAGGADVLAHQIWTQAGLPTEIHTPDWQGHGKRAGFERNALMVYLGADLCLAFRMPCEDPKCRRPEPHITHGTQHCMGLALQAGIRVRPYPE